MSVVVVAHVHPVPGATSQVLAGFATVADLIHAEQGCELYAVHSDGDHIVIVERWSSQDDLDAHARGQALATLAELNDGLLSGPADVFVLENVPMGEPHLGTIQ